MIKFTIYIYIYIHTLRRTLYFTIIQYCGRSKLYIPSQENLSQHVFQRRITFNKFVKRFSFSSISTLDMSKMMKVLE